MKEQLELGKKVIDMAQSAGAKESAVNVSFNRDVECELRDGKIEKLSDSQPRAIDLQLYVDGRYASHNTTDLRPASLEKFVKEAVALTRLLQADPNRSLPEAKWTKAEGTTDLQIYDASLETRQVEQRVPVLQAMEKAARAAGKDIVSITTGVGESYGTGARVTSNGVQQVDSRSSCEYFTGVTLREGDKRPEDYWTQGKTRVALHEDPARVGRIAAERAMGRIGAKKVPSGAMPIVVEARAAIRLFSTFNAALGGQALQQKRSFLEGKRGQKVMSDKLTLRDDPTIVGALNSRHFDGEGLAAKPMHIVRAGVLENYYINWYYSRKLGVDPTTGGMSNLVVEPGKSSEQELIAKMKKGLVVTAFLGGNSNALTGDFSFGVAGYAVENGQRTHAVAEVNLSGNHKTFWTQIAEVGNNPFTDAALRAPSLLIDGAAISGA